uniref:AlNc14C347G10865 protein n=1 Tax=Albugo laibachii Nc14 TaxID=890382 RepID=F0WXB3_9STRA|nr:AlNc14C347G10865 [Albugo laibachii Nc14]|eukprot:CCA26105.1 AlNc14C347G10865 [Albugo laibachii Nc14]
MFDYVIGKKSFKRKADPDVQTVVILELLADLVIVASLCFPIFRKPCAWMNA